MSAATLILLLCSWQPGDHPPGFPYPQLPTEAVCELCYHQCETDRAVLAQQLQFAGGWHRAELQDLKAEPDRLTATWYAAWWVTWSRTGDNVLLHCMPAGDPVIVEISSQREEWAGRLVELIGAEAFHRGELPLPLGAR